MGAMGVLESAREWARYPSPKLALQQQAVLDVDPSVARYILEDLVDQHDITFDGGRLRGQQSTDPITYTYDWTIESAPGGSVIQEHGYVDPVKHYVDAVLFIGIGGLFLALAGHVSVGIVWPVMLLWLFNEWYLSSGEIGVIHDLIEKSVEFDRLFVRSVLVAVILVLAIVGGVGILAGTARLVTWIGWLILFFGFVYAIASHRYASCLQRIDYRRLLPSPTIEYLSITLVSITPVGLAVSFYHVVFHFDQTLFSDQIGFNDFPAKLLVLQIGVIYFVWRSLSIVSQLEDSIREVHTNYRLFRHGERSVNSRLIQTLSVGFALVPGMASLLFVWVFLETYGAQFQQSLLFQGLMAIILLPTGLHFMGLVSQSTIPPFRIGRQLWQSDQPDFPVPDFIDANVRVHDGSGVSAASLSFGIASYIIVSRDLAEAISSKELHAILAHEQGHIQYGDAIISVLIPYLATVLLIGRNALYGALDFRAREFRADAFAVKHTTAETYIRALENAHQVQQETTLPGIGPGFSSIVDGHTEGEHWLREYLLLFYGTFAMSQAHPELDQRIHAIRHQREAGE